MREDGGGKGSVAEFKLWCVWLRLRSLSGSIRSGVRLVGLIPGDCGSPMAPRAALAFLKYMNRPLLHFLGATIPED